MGCASFGWSGGWARKLLTRTDADGKVGTEHFHGLNTSVLEMLSSARGAVGFVWARGRAANFPKPKDALRNSSNIHGVAATLSQHCKRRPGLLQ